MAKSKGNSRRNGGGHRVREENIPSSAPSRSKSDEEKATSLEASIESREEEGDEHD